MLAYEPQVNALAQLGRVLSEPIACRLLLALAQKPHHRAELADRFGLAGPALAERLSDLCGSGLVQANLQDGRVHYDIADPHLAGAIRELVDIVTTPEPETTGEPARTWETWLLGE